MLPAIAEQQVQLCESHLPIAAPIRILSIPTGAMVRPQRSRDESRQSRRRPTASSDNLHGYTW
jgi:hypothetical protein